MSKWEEASSEEILADVKAWKEKMQAKYYLMVASDPLVNPCQWPNCHNSAQYRFTVEYLNPELPPIETLYCQSHALHVEKITKPYEVTGAVTLQIAPLEESSDSESEAWDE